MNYSYKDGYREGVVFAFLHSNKVLIEHRPTSNEDKDSFFPNGSVEEKDHENDKDYKEVCLLREVGEEFGGKVKLIDYDFLCEHKVDSINIVFYTYLITKWEGEIPAYTVEEGEKFADLEWINLSEYKKYLFYDTAHKICELIIKSPLSRKH